MTGGNSIEEYRSLYKDYENMGSEFSSMSGLSGSEYWIMLMIREGVGTQSEISRRLLMSKQTVNSAGKQLVLKGLIRMETLEGNLRKKQISLTRRGAEFCERYIDPISDAEERAWYLLTESERETFIALIRKINELMRRELDGCGIPKTS